MANIQILDKTFKPYIKEADILKKVEELGALLSDQYRDRNPLLISILNGSFMFTSDLMKLLTIPCEVSFVKLASYHGTQSTGQVNTIIGMEKDIKGRAVLIIEDIIDTGNTLAAFLPTLAAFEPASVEVISLISKPKALKHPIKIAQTCFEIPNDFIVGYGLDYDGYGRNLRDIFVISE